MRDGTSAVILTAAERAGSGGRVANVEWLLREAMDGWALRTGQRNLVDDERWRSSIERLQLGPGLRVFLFEAAAHQDVTLEMRSEAAAPRWLGGQVTISGC